MDGANSREECGNEENKEEHSERILSHYIVYYTQFLVIVTFGTVLTGLWPYLNKLDPAADKIFLGYLFAASGLGQALFSPVIGYCSNKLESTRILFVITILINIISLLIHAFCESFTYHRKYWLLFSRFLAGVAAANVTICRSHISATTLIHERRKTVSLLSSTAIVALGLGAAMQFVMIPIGDAGFWIIPGVLIFNMYSSVAWILIIFDIINLILFHPTIFKEHSMFGREDLEKKKDSYNIRNYKCLAWVFIMFNFLITFNSMFTKVLGTPIAMDEFAMDRSEAVTLNSIINAIGAVLAFITSMIVAPLCKYLSEFRALVIGLGIFVLGRCLFYPIGSGTAKVKFENDTIGCPLSQEWCSSDSRVTFLQYILGSVFESVGYTLSIVVTMIIFSKLLGSRKQGTWMGILTSTGSLSRVMAPVFISRIYTNYGPSMVTMTTNVAFITSVVALLKVADYCILEKENEDVPINQDIETK